MSSRLGPLQIECDAPPYMIVSACRKIGFEYPEDVRWQRMSGVRHRWAALTHLFGPASWSALLGGKEPAQGTCSCGQPLPALETCSFLYRSGKTAAYKLGQCRACHTIYWDEA